MRPFAFLALPPVRRRGLKENEPFTYGGGGRWRSTSRTRCRRPSRRPRSRCSRERASGAPAWRRSPRPPGCPPATSTATFENKSALYEAVLPDTFVSTLQRLLRQRVEAARGVEDVRKLEPTAPYRLVSEEVLAFCLAHRPRVVVLLSSPEGTPHEHFAEELIEFLIKAATARLSTPGPHAPRASPSRNSTATTSHPWGASSVTSRRSETSARPGGPSRYHLTGLTALFAP